MAFKRVRKALVTFRTLGEKVTPTRRKKLEGKFREQGIFDYNDQMAQVRSYSGFLPDAAW